MALWQGESKRKKTGGRLRHRAGKKRREIGRESKAVAIGEEKKEGIRVTGGGSKIRSFTTSSCCVTDPSGKSRRTKILDVVENRADPHLVRSDVITKGAIILTEMGKVKVTSRPGQVGMVQGVLIEEKK
jgi:small subunit ribosomal protein S8e